MEKLIEENIDKIRKLCDAYSVKKLYVFGSAATENMDKDSESVATALIDPPRAIKTFSDLVNAGSSGYSILTSGTKAGEDIINDFAKTPSTNSIKDTSKSSSNKDNVNVQPQH